MKKLFYTTYEFFIDVDYPIVKELNKHFDFEWIVFLISSNQPRFTKQEVLDFAKQNNISIKIYEIKSRARSPKQLIKDFKCVLYLKKQKSDLYYFQTFFTPYISLLTWLFLPLKKTIVSIHDVIPHTKSQSLFLYLNHCFYSSMFKNYHIFSESQQSIFRQKHPGKNIMMARLCLKDYGKAKRTSNPSVVNFLFFGDIRYNKGLEYLIKAADLLSMDTKKFIVTICGSCDNFEKYSSIMKNPDIFKTNIKVFPNHEISKLFVNSDFLVLPYRDVTQSGPLHIAYNYNIPVIASDFPGFREYIINNKSGYLFEPCNHIALYECMKKAILLSKEEYQEIKNRVKEFSEKEINLNNIIKSYVDFFEKLN